ncbi:MAG: hypothetical protein HYS22_09035 [Deltaproteobacteria bacterium]|nr:hypothetical protein [Deltaproteobacteria bacterium]
MVVLILAPQALKAYGPTVVNTTTNTAIKWSMPMTYQREGSLTVNGFNTEPFLTNAVSAWQGADGSDVVMSATTLKDTNNADVSDVTGDTVCSYLYDASICPNGPTGDGQNPIVLDADGSIVAKFFGEANRAKTLGFAGIVRFSTSNNSVAKGEGVFNVVCLDGAKSSACPSGTTISQDDLEAIITHELGHFLGCNHSQVNLTEATDDDASNNQYITTMYSFLVSGSGVFIKTLERDDEICVANLYPSSGFSSGICRLEGTVFDQNGKEMQCANVIARNTKSDQSKTDAISYLSGQLSAAGTLDGDFVIIGLKPGETYSLEVEAIYPKIIGSSGIKPCDSSPAGYPSGSAFPPTFDNYKHAATFACAKGGDSQTAINITLANVNANPGTGTANPTNGGGGDSSSNSGGCSLIP